mmetsp:Transcript_19877/g.28766  ORF Transcript_19877/g.28766 Transcript_19877/m.28766 type:complete len:229 (-) Transcript_19877:83-769(-)
MKRIALEESQKYCQDRLREKPGNPNALRLLAPINLALEASSGKRWGIRDFRRALEADPFNADMWNDLGLQLHKAGKWEAALVAMQKGLEVNQRHLRLHSNLAAILSARGEYYKGIVHANKAIELQPTNPTLHRNISKMYDAVGDSRLALEHMRIAVRRDAGAQERFDGGLGGAQAYRDLSIWSVAQRQTERWHAHDLWDTHRALKGQQNVLPTSQKTLEILVKTKTKA